MAGFFALFLVVYGLAHPAMATAPASWVSTGLGLDTFAAQAAICAFGGLAIVGFVLAAASLAGIVVPRRWARSLIVASSVTSLLMLAVGFGPAAVPGLVIDAALVWIAIATPAPVAAVFSR